MSKFDDWIDKQIGKYYERHPEPKPEESKPKQNKPKARLMSAWERTHREEREEWKL